MADRDTQGVVDFVTADLSPATQLVVQGTVGAITYEHAEFEQGGGFDALSAMFGEVEQVVVRFLLANPREGDPPGAVPSHRVAMLGVWLACQLGVQAMDQMNPEDYTAANDEAAKAFKAMQAEAPSADWRGAILCNLFLQTFAAVRRTQIETGGLPADAQAAVTELRRKEGQLQ